jgi:hypothetical protein
MKRLAGLALAVGSVVGVGVASDAAPVSAAASGYNCGVRTPQPPSGTVCYNGVWVYSCSTLSWWVKAQYNVCGF